ncbi:MAG: ferredoxin [Phycisphaerae bacterium]|nr:ferredoxin [Phycisphaerae bacterium]
MSPHDADSANGLTRRDVLRGGCIAGLGAAAGWLLTRDSATGGPAAMRAGAAGGERRVWQIDPSACVQCGRCATECVLEPSAVKCVHAYALCGRCDFCFGYYESRPGSHAGAGAEYQLCPTGAIERRHIEGQHYDYLIDEATCIGCARCVEGCNTFGNGSLYLQVRHDRCLNCNECAIAKACPSQAFRLVPAGTPYLPKGADA